MEPDQQPTAEKVDHSKLKQADDERQNNESSSDNSKQLDENRVKPTVPQEFQIETSVRKESETIVTQSNDNRLKELKTEQHQQESNKVQNDETKSQATDETVLITKSDSSNNDEKTSETKSERPKSPDLPTFPGTVTKSVPGSNDVKIEIDSSSLLDRVILYSLKNTIVDNSRLDAAKNKLMMNNGNLSSSFSSNSNGSDSNSSSKSVDKLIEEFKGNGNKINRESPPTVLTSAAITPPMNNEKSDNGNGLSNGAEKCVNLSKSSQLENSTEGLYTKQDQDVIKDTQSADNKPLDSFINENNKINSESNAVVVASSSGENQALDFRDKQDHNASPSDVPTETQTGMLDLTTAYRDDKSVPPIKRSHALYVTLPDFSKQIFSAPSISRQPVGSIAQSAPQSASNISAPKIRNPDFSTVTRAPELQMRHPDFSKGFTKAPDQQQPTVSNAANMSVTPSNFPEIIRKNNYISDLQLKPPSNAQMSPSTSYKIDYKPITTQTFLQEPKKEPPSPSPTQSYPNMKKEGINAYNQQMIIDEPMAHIIHKNNFNSSENDTMRPSASWHERSEKLLGGSQAQVIERPLYTQDVSNVESKPSIPVPSQSFQTSHEDMRKYNPAHYQHAYKDREYSTNQPQEINQTSDFSLKQKEQLLRQEGTYITIKSEPPQINPPREIIECRSADLFRDYKLKQPKESPDSRRHVDQAQMNYQQQYPDFPSSYPKYPPHIPKTEFKPATPVMPPQDYISSRQVKPVATSSIGYHSPSPVGYLQPKSPLTVPPPLAGPNLMNPPQSWPSQPPPTSTRQGSAPQMQPNQYQTVPKLHPNQSQSPQSSYPGYHYPMQSSANAPTTKYNPAYAQQRYPDQSRQSEQKYVPQHYGSNMPQNYYHQKYPDFSRHFDPDRKPPQADARYPGNNFVPPDNRQMAMPDPAYQRLPARPDIEMRAIRDQADHARYRSPDIVPPPHSEIRERDYNRYQDYIPRVQEQVIVRKLEHPARPHSDNDRYDDRSRGHVPIETLKRESRSEDPPKIYPSSSSSQLQNPQIRRPEPIAAEVSVIAKVKIEPSPSVPSTSSIIKSTKSIFAEKRESPLDLSVKTVKTKADSTGCDSDFSSRRRTDANGLKVEFTPNFSKVSKTDCRQQARLGPQDFPIARPVNNVAERSIIPITASREQGAQRIVLCARPPSPPRLTNQQPAPLQQAPNERNFYPDHRFPTVAKDIDRPHAPLPSLPNNTYYNNQVIPSSSTISANRPVIVPNHSTYSLTELQPPQRSADERSRIELNANRDYHMSPHQPSAAYSVPNKQPQYSRNPAEVPKSSKIISPQVPSSEKGSLYLERERDRKYVEDILYRRNKKETPPSQPDNRHFQPILSEPRKRSIEQPHIQGSYQPKQLKTEESLRPIIDPRSSEIVPQQFNQSHQFQKYEPHRFPPFESHIRSPQIGTPPALVKHESYGKTTPTQPDTKYYPDPRKDAINKSTASYASPHPYYPNPKAEMIQRSDQAAGYKYVAKESEKVPYQPQNFQQRPDDNIFQTFPRIHHPIQHESGIKYEQQIAGPLPGTSGESSRINVNGLTPLSISGSNGNIAQSTIQKLKTNLELKEQQKLKTQSGEIIEDFEQKKDLSPRQFRTKGELKGFIPLPLSTESKNSTATSAQQQTNDQSLPTGSSAFDLLDWGSACNDFVQQLQTGKKRSIKKKRSVVAKNTSEDKSSGTSTIPGTTSNNLSEVPKEIMKSIIMKSTEKDAKVTSSDEDKPLLELINLQNGTTSKASNHNVVVEKISEKISRNIREKQRLELEQKIAARLGKPSSSESESEARRPIRTATRVRRLRKRATLGMKKTDEESAEEEETDETATISKRRISKSILKLDDLTSTDEEKRKVSLSEKKCSVDQKSKTNTKKLSTSKANDKKKESSSESSDSSDESDNKQTKIAKLSSSKNVKKLKDLGDGSSIKNLLEEEETMTRSKRKLEIEKKLSNSKVLRNEKVIQNISPDKKAKLDATNAGSKKSPPKRKDSTKSVDDLKRKILESDSDDNNGKSKRKTRRVSKIQSSSSAEESQHEEENKTERLRPRKNKPELETLSKVSKDKKKIEEKSVPKTNDAKTLGNAESDPKQQTLPCRIPFSEMFSLQDEEKTSKFKAGWETETYNFKRSLKVPAGLITIGRPPQHGISHSLPDLDPQTSDTSEIFSEFVKSKDKNGSKDGGNVAKEAETSKNANKKAQEKSKPSPPEKKSNSIIDVLHQRVVQQTKRKLKPSKRGSNIQSPLSKPNDNDDNLMPTPEKESDKVFGFKKNIFETSVLTSRLRNENNAIRKKEILKEVFGAEDRPRSAPPASLKNEIISFDQKYREYLEMSLDFSPKASADDAQKSSHTSIKDEDEDDDDNETVISENVTPALKGKVKRSRTRRCKGSSGFDYIRKKKKPTPNASENPMSVNNIIKKRLAAMENLENKDENDISKEIKGWVLNKGVGESVLHKASRLGYIDVIAYCLDRLNMNPDPKDNAGYTPLHEACSRGHLDIARLLLQYGANHSETAHSGIRPLHEAVENGFVEIVRLLLSYGADPCLATYSGQTPIQLAEDKEIEEFLRDYLIDVGNMNGINNRWYFDGPFRLEDPEDLGYEIFNNFPINSNIDLGSSMASVLSTSLTSLVTATTQMSDNETVASESTATPIKMPAMPMKAPASQDLVKYQHKMKKCDTNSNNLVMSDTSQDSTRFTPTLGKKTKNCGVIVNNIDATMKKIKKLPAIQKQELTPPKLMHESIQKMEEIKQKDDYDDMIADGDHLESDCEFLEVEESETPLPPLYLLRDEGTDKWVLLTDLCNLLKVKSKDAVLKQIFPSSPPSNNKDMTRELKMNDFLEKAICLQLFCAGEKLNIRSSKVVLVRYNDSVRSLLGVQTIRMNM